MKLLVVDIGTGTQDMLLWDSRVSLENAFKMVLPSPTMIVQHQVKSATLRQVPILLTGRQMGGGPSAWAVLEHVRAGLPAYATPDAALTLDDDLARVAADGINLVSEEEALRLPDTVQRVRMGDFDLARIASSFREFGVSLDDLDAVGVAVFDHGAAPPGISDRRFRFDFLDRQIRRRNSLTSFAYRSTEIPPEMSRLTAVSLAAADVPCPLVVMDTAPAAILGATLDPVVAALDRPLIVNVGNFHALAFRLNRGLIEGLFEHHTGEINLAKLEVYLRRLCEGSLQNADVFDDMGHGALVYPSDPLPLGTGDFDVVVTGPRRNLMRAGGSGSMPLTLDPAGHLRPYFAVPCGDMMLSGCFGLLAAMAELLPFAADAIKASLRVDAGGDLPPWELD